MGVTKDKIIVEDKLREIFAYLPDMKGIGVDDTFSIHFKVGDELELNKFLANKQKRQDSPYPLIWLTYPYVEQHNRTNVACENINLVLAMKTNNSYSVEQRIETSYKEVLYPLFNNIEKALTRASNTDSPISYGAVKFPNYSGVDLEGSEAGAIELWDALRVRFDITFTDNCLRPIKI